MRSPEYVRRKTARSAHYLKEKRKIDPDFRKHHLELKRVWFDKNADDAEFMKKHRASQHQGRMTHKRKKQAKIAAALLTETLGIPHVVVETIDANGKKTFQPAPKGQRT